MSEINKTAQPPRWRMAMTALCLGMAALLTGPVQADEQRIGGNLSIDGPVDGDINLIGGNLTVDADVDGDVRVIGGSVRVAGTISGSLRAVGGDVEIAAVIEGDLSAAGGDLDISSASRIGEDAEIAGGNVDMAGDVAGDLEVAGGDVLISGTIGGDVEAFVRDLEFGPSARIVGDLTVRGPNEPEIPDGIVGGRYEYEYEPGFNAEWRSPVIGWGPHRGQSFGGAVIMGLWAFVGGLVLVMVFPGLTERAIQGLRTRPLRSLAYGFGFIVLLPVAAVILIATVIGLPIGIFLLFLYPFLLFAGYVSAALGASRLVLPNDPGAPISKGKQLLYLAVALVVIAVLAVIPVIGPIVTVGLLLTGVGAFGAALFGGKEKAVADA